MVNQFKVVSIVLVKQGSKLFDVVFTRLSLSQLGDVHEDVYGLLDLQIDHADIHWLVVLILLLQGSSIAVHLFVYLLLFLLILLLLFLLFVILLMEVFAFDVSG